MPDFNQRIPDYLTEKRNIVRLTFFTAAFALVFINVYAPFGVNVWLNLTTWQLFFYSSLVILTGVLVVAISRIIMYYVSLKRIINYWQYGFWIVVEIFLMALFYSIYIKYILHDNRFLPDLLKLSIQNTALVLLLPYSLLWLYFSYIDKKVQLSKLKAGESAPPVLNRMIPFLDEKGILRISIKEENILFLETADNYIHIYYLNKEKVSRFVLRNSLKNMEESLKGSLFVRCHRSYMVNSDKVKLIRKTKEGIKLELESPENTSISVSKTYLAQVLHAFTQFAPEGD